jgi:hypothetical protein
LLPHFKTLLRYISVELINIVNQGWLQTRWKAFRAIGIVCISAGAQQHKQR